MKLKSKSLIILIISILLGAATFGGIFYYLSISNEQVEIVVAGQGIPPYTEITKDMIKLDYRPKIIIGPDAASKIEYVEGKYTDRIGLHTGDIVSREKVIKKEEAMDYILSKEIPVGSRGIGLSVDYSHAVGGMIQNNDYVDISLDLRSGDEVRKITPVECIRVIALKDKDGLDRNMSKEEVFMPTVVIVEAPTPEVRDAIVKVADKGSVHLSLRNPNDIIETKINKEAINEIEQNQQVPKDNTAPSGETINTKF